MNQVTINNTRKWLKISIAIVAIPMLSILLLAFSRTEKMADEFWKQLGLTQQQTDEKIKTSFLNGYLDYYGVKNIKNIAAGNRPAITKDMLTYAKNYAGSPSFLKLYDAERKAAKPQEPDKNVKTKEEVRKQAIADMQKSIDAAEETVKKFPAMEKDARPTIDMLKASIKDYKDPNSQYIESLYQYEILSRDQRVAQYEQDLKKWDENYPADFKLRISKYLEKYLSLANTVDFNAALQEKYGKMRFVNPDYERRSSDWKLIFRAGKEVYGVTKPFAEQWLKDLQ
jgi:hypothetical protein